MLASLLLTQPEVWSFPEGESFTAHTISCFTGLLQLCPAAEDSLSYLLLALITLAHVSRAICCRGATLSNPMSHKPLRLKAELAVLNLLSLLPLLHSIIIPGLPCKSTPSISPHKKRVAGSHQFYLLKALSPILPSPPPRAPC